LLFSFFSHAVFVFLLHFHLPNTDVNVSGLNLSLVYPSVNVNILWFPEFTFSHSEREYWRVPEHTLLQEVAIVDIVESGITQLFFIRTPLKVPLQSVAVL